ncbi:MAG: hypothetical protein F6K55_18830 [Moorea sp. SIO4A3]|nr:hypothetical protein [Moorena sp. SIO4A3]
MVLSAISATDGAISYSNPKSIERMFVPCSLLPAPCSQIPDPLFPLLYKLSAISQRLNT